MSRRLGVRTIVVPLVLSAVTAAVVWWVRHASLDAVEVLALRGGRIGARAREHVVLSTVSTGIALAFAVPAGIVMSRRRLRAVGAPVLFLANIGQTVPTIAILALMLTFTGIGFKTAVIALAVYSLLPILQNTLVGLRGIDPAIVEAARGMGMAPMRILMRVELPLALPVIVAGIRTAAVVNVGTAALAAFIGAGGLGQIIAGGLTTSRDSVLYVGAILTAVLALAVDWLIGTIGALVSPGRS